MILDFGYLCMEIFSDIDILPKTTAQTKTTGHFVRTGGQAATTSITAARMGAKVSVIGTIGSDLFGKAILDTLRRDGVNSAGIAKSALPTGLIQTITQSNGAQTCLMNTGANIETKSAQIPDRILNIRTMVLLHDDVDMQDNLDLARRAKANDARIMMLSRDLPDAQILDTLDYLITSAPAPKSLKCAVFTPEKDATALEREIFCGALAACLQSNMPPDLALSFAKTALRIKKGQDDPYPYLADVVDALQKQAGG